MLTTDDILARLQPRRLWRLPRQTVPLAATAVAVVALCYGAARLVGADAPGTEAAPTARVLSNLSTAPLADASSAEAAANRLTPVSVHLSTHGSIFIDGRRMGMGRQHHLELAPGTHWFMVRFGRRSYRKRVEVGVHPLRLACDFQRGFGRVPAADAPQANP
jgi:hypothetical protein